MASKDDKFEQNITGKYYVDDQCIACDACVYEAETFFEMNDDEGHAFVSKQPTNDEEEESCQNALMCCPVGAIGDDGTQE
jgi:ferredoxin